MPTSDLPANKLKRKLATGKDFAAVMRFFFDSFVDQPDFLNAGHPITVPSDLEEAIGKVVAHVWPKRNVITEWKIVEVPLLGIIHGTVMMNGKPSVLLWAPDIGMGIIALPDVLTGNTMYARITVSQPAKPQ